MSQECRGSQPWSAATSTRATWPSPRTRRSRPRLWSTSRQVGVLLGSPILRYEAKNKRSWLFKSFLFPWLDSWLNSDLFRPLALVSRSKIALLRHTQKRLFSLFSGVFEHVLEWLFWTYRQVPGV